MCVCLPAHNSAYLIQACAAQLGAEGRHVPLAACSLSDSRWYEQS